MQIADHENLGAIRGEIYSRSLGIKDAVRQFGFPGKHIWRSRPIAFALQQNAGNVRDGTRHGTPLGLLSSAADRQDVSGGPYLPGSSSRASKKATSAVMRSPPA